MAAGLAALSGGLALLAAGVTAMAAPPTGPQPVPAARLLPAAVAPTVITTQYSCDLSGYGSGIPAATLTGKLTIPGAVVATQPLAISLATTASDTLPAAVVTALHGVTEFDFSAALTQEPANPGGGSSGAAASATPTASPSATPTPTATSTSTSSAVPLNGTAQAQAPATITSVPAATVTGAARFVLTGTGVIVAPATTLTITPRTSSAALAAITCTTTDTTRDVPVTVTPQTFGTSGPLYVCRESIESLSNTEYVHVVASLTTTGKRTVGTKQTVTYRSPSFGAASWPTDTTSVDYTGSLPVTGAQTAQIPLSQPVDPNAAQLKLSGKIKLAKPGTDHVAVPAKFTITIHDTALPAPIIFACAIKSPPPPVGLSIAVRTANGTPGPTPSPSATASPSATPAATGGGQPLGSAAPSGGPATGGGLGHTANTAMAVAGGAMATAGGGLVLAARRRRDRQV